MASRIDYTRTFIGRVKEIVIDGTTYPITDDGVVITQAAEYAIKPLVGDLGRRGRVSRQYYQIDVTLAENTLANMKLAWNLPAGIVGDPDKMQTLYLGRVQSPTVRTLEIRGWIYRGNDATRQRRWFFDQVCFYNPKPQSHVPTALTPISVSFYAYGNSAAAAGEEFGHIEQDLQTDVFGSILLLEDLSFLLLEDAVSNMLL